MMEVEKDLELKKLDHFFGGTENYYKFHMGTVITEGVKYVCDNGYYWFVSDAVIAIKAKRLDKKSWFLVARLKLDDSKAKMIIDDGDGNVLHTQSYEFTDAKRELELYFADDVVMLPSEY